MTWSIRTHQALADVQGEIGVVQAAAASSRQAFVGQLLAAEAENRVHTYLRRLAQRAERGAAFEQLQREVQVVIKAQKSCS